MNKPNPRAVQAAYGVEAATPFCGEWLKIRIIMGRAHVTDREAQEALLYARKSMDTELDYVEEEVRH
jgi:hypothetical protein